MQRRPTLIIHCIDIRLQVKQWVNNRRSVSYNRSIQGRPALMLLSFDICALIIQGD